MSGNYGRWGGLLRSIVLVSSLLVSACSTLPVSGPTGREIEKAGRDSSVAMGQLPFRVIEVADAAAVPPQSAIPISSLITPPPIPTNLVGPGDVLSITIYEAGVSLFAKPATRVAAEGSGAGLLSAGDVGANAQTLPGVRVDDEGFIRLPFVGRLRASGHTTADLETIIRNRLRGMSQDPQVSVAIDQSITNSVVLAGEVNRPGRFVLPTTHQTLSDTIALAGGYKGEAKDVVARVARGDDSFEIRLSDLLDSPDRDVPIVAGDRITLIARPQSFSVLGAPNKAEQIRFPRGHISLAEAVALAGGANPNQGDAAAIFVFRYLPGATGAQPVVYHFNMMRPGALFLSQRFMMKDKDLLYVGNAQANQPTKLVQLLSQLFLPIATVRTTVGGSIP